MSNEQTVTYAKVGGPPWDYWNYEVFDVDTGHRVAGVIEVDASHGWLRRHKCDKDGYKYVENNKVAEERLCGRFEIKRKAYA